MIILMLVIALVTEITVAGAVLSYGGGWLLALVVAQGVGCAAVMGVAFVGSSPRHIRKIAGARSAV